MFLGTFFLDFPGRLPEDVSSIRLSSEIAIFGKNLPDPFSELRFLLKPRRNGFLLYFQSESVPCQLFRVSVLCSVSFLVFGASSTLNHNSEHINLNLNMPVTWIWRSESLGLGSVS